MKEMAGQFQKEHVGVNAARLQRQLNSGARPF
jgi:hypothetical protein